MQFLRKPFLRICILLRQFSACCCKFFSSMQCIFQESPSSVASLPLSSIQSSAPTGSSSSTPGSFGTLFLRSLSLHKPCKQLWRPNGRHIFHQGPLLRCLVLHSVHLLHTSMPLRAFLHFVPWELSLHPQVYWELHLKVGVSLLLLCRHLYLLFAPLCIC